VPICANCGAEVPPRFNFCGACGASVPAVAEHDVRKTVTVLFCDITDSTGLGEREDPERLRSVLGRYFDEIERIIAAHGGLVEKFIGDAVMAVFGLPSAHEDDALRAVRAAAEVYKLPATLAEQTGLELAFRTGINTGEVVAGSGQTLVTGDAVNVAARLEEGAQPGEILLGRETVALLGPLVEAERLAPLDVPGKASPVAAYRFHGLVTPEERRVSAFVDRERELSLLGDAFRRTAEGRELHLFTLLGPAGIGKSRLVAEFVDSLTDAAEIVRGRCLSYGQGITFWPLVEVLRGLGEPAAPTLDRVLAGGATSPQQLAWTVQQALEGAAAERPLLVVLEDLHWAEPTLLDLLDLVCELSRDAPILLLCVARPELLEQRPNWGGGKPNATSILLEPLPRSDGELLLERLPEPLEPERRAHVLEIAAGNPLFLEELSTFVAEGGGDGELPPRIHALLQARLDLLPEPERHMLACAAVAGTVVHGGSLEGLVETEIAAELPVHLAALTRKWLIRPAGAELEGAEGFRFRHELIRDVAYGELPKEERARLHEAFACWVEGQSGEREELEEIKAYHLEQAALCKRELGASDVELEARAGAALSAAGERAHLRIDLRAAAGFWRRALAVLEEEDVRVPQLELALALELPWLGQFAEAQQLLDHAARQTADPSVAAAARLAGLHARLRSASDDIPAAIKRECASAIPLFEEGDDHRRLALAWYLLAQAEMAELQVRAAAQAWENAAAQAGLAGDRAFEMLSRCECAERIGNELRSRAATVRELERLAEEFPGEPVIDVTLTFCRALVAYQAGRREQARVLAGQALDGFRRHGVTVFAAIHTAAAGRGEMLGGDLDEAERLALAGIRELREVDEHTWLGWALTWLAEIRIAQGRHAEALEIAHEAERHAPHDRRTLIGASCHRAHAHARIGAVGPAKAAAAAAVALAETTDSLYARADAQYALAEAMAAAGEFPAALAAADEAAGLYAALEYGLLERRAATLAEEIERRSPQFEESTTAV
jgi:class 3 adenylate cyclase